MKVLLIGGTQDARQIAQALAQNGVSVLLTVTTDHAKALVEPECRIDVLVAKLNQQQLQQLISVQNIATIVDASHPYAQNISYNAQQVAKMLGCNYMRYERPTLTHGDSSIHNVDDYHAAAVLCNQTTGNILLTTGSNHLPVFAEHIKDFTSRVYARVLPTTESIAKAQAVGLTTKQIIAVQGPFSTTYNIAMLRHINAKTLVSKQSGSIGGISEKLDAAKTCGVQVIMIKRPDIVYQSVYRSIEELISKIDEQL